MSLTLLDRHMVPHGGFTFREVRTNTRLTAATLWYLAELVIKHRKANPEQCGTDIPGMEATMAEIEAQLCATAPPNTCRDKDGIVKQSGFALTLETITRGAATLTDWFITHGRKKVTMEQATERGRICGNCPANRRPEACTPCNSGFFKGLAEVIVGGDATPHDPLLHSCAYCGCLLSQKIWLPLDVLLKHTPGEELERMPEYCWMRTEKPEA